MRVRVVRLRSRGVALTRKDVNHADGIVGELYVEEHVNKELGRTLRAARLAGNAPVDEPLLPPLLDAQLLWAGNHGFVLGGIEQLSSVAYAQSWYCQSC